MKSTKRIDIFHIESWELPNGDLHREDGPAVIYSNGDKEWFLNGKRHREDGPASIEINGDKEWWLNNEEYSEEEYKKKIKKKMRLDKLNKILN